MTRPIVNEKKSAAVKIYLQTQSDAAYCQLEQSGAANKHTLPQPKRKEKKKLLPLNKYTMTQSTHTGTKVSVNIEATAQPTVNKRTVTLRKICLSTYTT